MLYELEFRFTEFSIDQIEKCHIVYVKRVEFVSDSELSKFPPDSTNCLELPTCPVCLERMDAVVSGLLTSICNHSFHCNCISKWSNNS